MSEGSTGTIFDLKRFAVHDGTGLRTTLFLKGCPLRCPWCQNPEGLGREPVLWYSPGQCLRCGTCVRDCSEGALSLDDRVHVDPRKCTLCGDCQAVCPAAALEVRGRVVTAEEAARMLMRDRIFFGERGGVTLSGGEVLFQWKFAVRVLSLCKEQGADTAVETSLMGSREALESLRQVTDHFMIDIKIFDRERHQKIIGGDNRIILENYEYLVRSGADVVVRTPLIPGFTADEENIRRIARYLVRKDPQARYELLNYNPLCRSKYEALEQPYPVAEIRPLGGEEMEKYYHILEEEGIVHIIRE